MPRWLLAGTAFLFTFSPGLRLSAGQDVDFEITIREEKSVKVLPALPVDPTPRIRYNPGNLSVMVRTLQNQSLHLSHYPVFHIDGQIVPQGAGGRFERANQKLGPDRNGKAREGYTTVFVRPDVRITMVAELVPSRAGSSAKKRQMDTMLLRYEVENLGKTPVKFGMRTYMDCYVVTNDGPLFAAPTLPGKLLDGIVLKDKTLPDYVQILQQPNLKNPGTIGWLTLELGGGLDKADKVVLTRHGVGRINNWDMQAVKSMGDAALGIFWEPRAIPPGGKRLLGYAYGLGQADPFGHEGRVEVRLAGSFHPGKLFSVTALVHDPAPGQTLVLDLPEGMELTEGREIQPVPRPLPGRPQSLVLWKGRVTNPGEFPLHIRSSTGTTLTKIVTVKKLP